MQLTLYRLEDSEDEPARLQFQGVITRQHEVLNNLNIVCAENGVESILFRVTSTASRVIQSIYSGYRRVYWQKPLFKDCFFNRAI
jgi:hypothetical protein